MKCGFLSRHFSQRPQQSGNCTKPLGNNNIYIKNVFQLSHRIKNNRQSKLYQWYTHLRKNILQLLLLKFCETFLFRHSKKVCSII